MGKGEIAPYEQFLYFLVFSKDFYTRHLKTRACLGKGQWVEKSVRKEEIAGYAVFFKRLVLQTSKNQGLFGKGLTNNIFVYFS